MTGLGKAVADSLLGHGLLSHGERVLVAVSGGADSMALLHLLIETRNGSCLAVAHFNHQLRGAESDEDEALVRSAAKRGGLIFYGGCADVRAFSRRQKLSLELAARQMRHEFLARTAIEAGFAKIALAHHADDQVELFLMRLFRGSGGGGLAGMKWQSPSPANDQVMVVRPLLNLPKAKLMDYIRTERIRFREDASNQKLEHTRNRVRHEILPVINRVFPNAAEPITRTANIVAAEADFVSQAAERWLRAPLGFDNLHIAIQRRVLHMQLKALGVGAGFDLVEKLRLSPGVRVSIVPGRTAVRSPDGEIRLDSRRVDSFENTAAVEVALTEPAGEIQFEDRRIWWRFRKQRRFTPPSHVHGREVFDADLVGSSIVLRHWRRGDRFQPIGTLSPLKLQDFFTNEKVLRKERHELILALTEAGEVFWVEGMRISERFKVSSRTRKRLLWHWVAAECRIATQFQPC